MVNNEKKTVRLTLTSKHIVPNLGVNQAMYSLFEQNTAADDNAHARPEDYPEEMNNAVQDMLDRDAGFTEGEIYDAGEAEAEGLFDCDDCIDEDFDPEQIFEEIWKKMQEMSAEEDDDDVYVFRTLAELSRREENGREIVEIRYTEGESMDETESVIVYDTTKPHAVTICRTGSVMSVLICEEGVRHISAYKTPIMPFEVAVYAKKCDGKLDYEYGGSIELDYIVEVRGADMQRTIMTVDAVVI